MVRVWLHQSPLAMFPHDIDGVVFDAPDHFHPIVGDALRFDLISRESKLAPALVFVVKVEWWMDWAGNSGRPEYTAALHLTVSSEMPAKTGTRRVHDNRKG
jgi:hypothetical protein